MPRESLVGTASDEIEKVRQRLGDFDPWTEPHIAIDMGGAGGNVAIRLGGRINLVVAPDKEGGIIPLVLTGISRTHLDFVAFSSNPQNRRQLRMKFKWSGEYQTGYRTKETMNQNEQMQRAKLEEDK